MGRPRLLPRLLLLLCVGCCIPASWALRCARCESSSSCQVEECAPGQDLCRTTFLRIWDEEEDLEVVERACTHAEKTNRTLSYRSGLQIISLTETVCGSHLCNWPRPPGRVYATFPQGRFLECVSCTSLDMSCERGREQGLQCRHPGEQCLYMVTHNSLKGSMNKEPHIRGCGYLVGCPGPTGFHNNHTFHFLKCCNTTKCNKGPVVELQNLPPNGIQCHSCEGNSSHGCSSEQTSLVNCRGPMDQCLEATGIHGTENTSYTVRGCATASWCHGSHVADTFSLTQLNVSCCTSSSCNHPAKDVEYRRGAASRPNPVPLSFTVTVLMTIRLWGGVLLWT
ncbi:urokinase plasminogen activator surface receptor [Ctenodactylus gundi]